MVVSPKFKMSKQGVLILTPFFSPAIGGTETDLNDLVLGLSKLGYLVYVHTYFPAITTPNVPWLAYEERPDGVKIWRYRWIGRGLFHKLEKIPFLDFLYLTPYLFLRVCLWLIFNRKKISVIHAQGLNAALVGAVLGTLFGIKLVVSSHALYEIDKNSITAWLIAHILKFASAILYVSEASSRELESFGVDKKKLHLRKHWINLEAFKPGDKTVLRKKLGIENKFTVLFVGRLLRKKGVVELVKVAEACPSINFVFIGKGSEETYLKRKEKSLRNVRFLGSVPNSNISQYYNSADIFCIPSQYEEAYGFVSVEAISCGVPVVGSNKGGIPEVVDNTVSILVEPTVRNLTEAITSLYRNPKAYKRLKDNCRNYAEKNYSEKNIRSITKYY